MQTILPTLAIIGLSLFAFTANAVSTEDKVINTPSAMEVVDEVYRNNQYGFSLQYPNSWKVKENQEGTNKKLTIKSPSGFTISLTARPNEPKGDCQVDTMRVMGTDAIKILGNDLTIHFVGNSEKNTITYAYLLSSNEPCPAFPYISLPNKGMVQIELSFDNLIEEPADVFKADDYQTAKEILSSITLR